MNFHADTFKTDNYQITSKLSLVTDDLKVPKNNLTPDTKSQQNLKDMVQKAKTTQKEKVKLHEKDDKKYKVFKRYGEILAKIENLLGLLPAGAKHLSLDELIEELQELMKSRKRNEQQMLFMFFQNLYSTTLKNLMTLEKDFQSGAISQSEAKKSIRIIQSQIEKEENHVPKVLEDTHNEVKQLVNLYSNSFSFDKTQTQKLTTSLTQPDLSTENKLIFEKLNTETSQLLESLSTLNTNLSNFEPQVDLSQLAKNLQATETLAQSDVLDVDRLDSSLSTLESTTNHLTDEQVEKNSTSSKLAEEIQTLTTQSTELEETSMKEVSTQTFETTHERANETIVTLEEVEAIINSDEVLPEAISEQIANTITAQIEADIDFCDKVCSDPNSASALFDKSASEEALEHAEELKSLVEQKQIEKGLVLTLKQNEELEDPENNENSQS